MESSLQSSIMSHDLHDEDNSISSLNDHVDTSSSSEEDETDGVMGFGRKDAQSSLYDDNKLKDRGS